MFVVTAKPLPERGRIQKPRIFALSVMYSYAWENVLKTTIPVRAIDLVQSPLASSDFESNCCFLCMTMYLSMSCHTLIIYLESCVCKTILTCSDLLPVLCVQICDYKAIMSCTNNLVVYSYCYSLFDVLSEVQVCHLYTRDN